jgi:3-deoxy-7-phosphoheptulonate synthase
MVPAVSAAAIAVGADGLLVEVHNRPEQALSDGVRSLPPAEFELLMNDLEAVSVAVGRR